MSLSRILKAEAVAARGSVAVDATEAMDERRKVDGVVGDGGHVRPEVKADSPGMIDDSKECKRV